MTLFTIISILAAAGLGGAAGYFLPSSGINMSHGDQEKNLEAARSEAEQIKRDSEEKIARINAAIKEEEESMQDSIGQLQASVEQKEDILKRRESRNTNYANASKNLDKEIRQIFKDSEELRRNSIEKLANASGLTNEKALEIARAELKEVITEDKEKRSAAAVEEFEEDIQRHAKAVLQVVVQRLGVPSSVDKNNTSVTVRDDKFKGQLIGRGGTNIAYLESLLPVSVIFNLGDPKTIHVGGVNLLRRHIAKRAINKMQKVVRKTGKITHKLIDETVEASEKEIMDECNRKGRWAFKQMDMDYKAVPDEVVNYVGRLYFRTSYGQNIIHHSLEMAFAARLIAELIGTDVETAMQAAFYHDLGKAIDHDVGGSHDDLSKEILEKHGFSEGIVHAAFVHHDKGPCLSPADFIVKAVDAISGGRPGARMESVTNYFERMKQLETL
ncbi:HDIG domain-containing protein, partial [Candidatus Peregrinibacteria bacterium]|nr:HDIG domain-containing protein [Candidatus Peregrinibacteria bacterium]